jgi:hypothetical protein
MKFRDSIRVAKSWFGILCFYSMISISSCSTFSNLKFVPMKLHPTVRKHSRPGYISSFLSRFPHDSRPLDCPEDIFTVQDMELIHVIPFSKYCRPFWLSSVQALAGLDEAGNTITDQQASLLISGIEKDEMTQHSLALSISSLLHIHNGRFYVEKDPAVAILPILTEEQILDWNGEGYKCLVIASSSDILGYIGAKNARSVSLASNASNLQEIKLAFSTFANMSRSFAALHCGETAPKHLSAEDQTFRPGEHSQKFCQEIRADIAKAGELWLPDPDDIPPEASFPVVEYAPVRVDEEIGELVQAGDRAGHAAPIPYMLQLRNLNAAINHAYKEGRFATVPPREGLAAALWPSCSDVDPACASCSLCRAHSHFTTDIFGNDVSKMDREEAPPILPIFNSDY